MSPNEIERRIRAVKVWKRHGERAPHKPLLLLYALGRYSRGEPRMIPYSDVDLDLRHLLTEFGPQRRSVRPEYPFWRLQSDGIWEIGGTERLQPYTSNSDAKKSELLRYQVTGGVPEEIYAELRRNDQLIGGLARTILDENFPTTIHEDILAAVGLDLQRTVTTRRARDPQFRQDVLRAYEEKCAVCGLQIRLGPSSLAIEAAHIMWHQAGGPDVVQNGLALCVLHHKLFDRGAFALSDARVIEVSEHLLGENRFGEYVMTFHGRELHAPQSPKYLPGEEFIHWHRREVFRGPARDLGAGI